MDKNDRRFFIHEAKCGKYLEYKRYVTWRDSEEGVAALWCYLLKLDMGDFDPQAPAPLSESKVEMITTGKSELGAWVANFFLNSEFILKKANITSDLLSMRQLHMLYDPTGSSKTTVNALAREFKREGYNPACKGAPVKFSTGEQVVVWPVRNIEKWLKASWSEVRDHCEANSRSIKVTGKF
jgi:hypothetical protein